MNNKKIYFKKRIYPQLYALLTIVFYLCTFGCFSMSEVQIPDALPPDAFINESKKPQINEPSPTQDVIEEKSYILSKPQKRDFLEYRRNEGATPKESNTLESNTSSTFTYKLNATKNVLIWIQDNRGNEVAWKNLSKNEEFLIYQKCPLTLTCSKPNALVIKDAKNKKISYVQSDNSSINIIRLP